MYAMLFQSHMSNPPSIGSGASASRLTPTTMGSQATDTRKSFIRICSYDQAKQIFGNDVEQEYTREFQAVFRDIEARGRSVQVFGNSMSSEAYKYTLEDHNSDEE